MVGVGGVGGVESATTKKPCLTSVYVWYQSTFYGHVCLRVLVTEWVYVFERERVWVCMFERDIVCVCVCVCVRVCVCV